MNKPANLNSLVRFKDKWFRITGICVLVASTLFLIKPDTERVTWTDVKQILLYVCMLILIWEGNRFLILYSYQLFTAPLKALKRMLFLVPANILYTAVILVLTKSAGHYIDHHEWKLIADSDSHLYINNTNVTMGRFGSTLFKSALISFFFFGFYGIFHYVMRLRTVEKEKEALQQQKNETELYSLKQQVNPHFLFNSLNSLSSLISEDPEKAEKFVDEMSKVYRYMLRNNVDGLTSLDAEMLFIQSYFHLLKTRYGDGLDMEIHIDERYLKYQLPALTLQMLVENAVKHNAVLKNRPLLISIKTTSNGNLVVRNNLQRKTISVASNQVGLSNISKKYRLMKHEDILVQDDGSTFEVTVPLIRP